MLGADALDARQRREVLDELFDYRPYLLASGAMALLVVQVFLSGARGEALICAVLVALGVMLRFLVDRVYRARSHREPDGNWAVVFGLTCVGVALLWGVTGAVLYRAADDSMRLAVLALGCVLVQAVTFRSYMAPGPTMVQVAILIGFHAIAIAYDGLYVLIPVCMVYTVFQGLCIVALGKVRIRQMAAERETRRLLGELQTINAELTRANLRLADSALSDPLTGVGNRRRFEEALATMGRAAARQERPLSLLLIDVDHFKRFNDEHGHVAGDDALRHVADRLRAIADGPEEVVTRFGGEEFAVLAGGTDEAAARALAGRILASVREAPCGSPLTVSIGVATARGAGGTADIVNAADRALYAAKRAGRNRVVCHGDGDDPKVPETAVR